MPAGFIPSEAAGVQLLESLGKNLPTVLPWQLWLWVNDLEPDWDVVLADLEPATFAGYSPVNLERVYWTTPTVHEGCAHSTWKTEPVIWYVTGGPVETIYGFAFVDVSNGIIRYIQRLDEADIRPVSIGGKVTLLPTVTSTSAECDP